MDLLDSPVWHALTGPQETVAQRVGDAVRFDPDYSVFAAVAPGSGPEAWADLRELVGTDPVLVFPGQDPPHDWTRVMDFTAVQMVLEAAPRRRPRAASVPDPVPLGPTHLEALDRLVTATEPGPWCPRTVELGPFVGIEVGGRLVATAGQRMRTAGAVEISAICTDPHHRGRGYAATLTATVAEDLQRSGLLPFLHVRHDNEPALATYRSIGFRERARHPVGVYQARS